MSRVVLSHKVQLAKERVFDDYADVIFTAEEHAKYLALINQPETKTGLAALAEAGYYNYKEDNVNLREANKVVNSSYFTVVNFMG